ncbi:cytidylyltransferase domain-containing protein [Legionella maioricensis]|uniref:Glycosyltransferase family protein n=1 Tax=Legionella maioricensis TaxID=2896528 RepID=A0A9X2CZT0_9GAMM|nr:glycosyltransferase family protein [Legionella maioricensis]MCL9683568.1 glycosyltransferase family protein [Legionella maioricensis]MCL9686867.1 glycosyltransferase family protein [Legionella maioricensis]
MPKVVASIEARMGSSRLPGKVLTDIGGVPALTRLIRRLRQCKALDDVVLATTTSSKDDELVAWAQTNNVPVFRGSEEDVLARVVGAHQMMGSDVVVEVTGDCPLLDSTVIDLGIETYFANDCDVVTNARVASYPQGADVQVFQLKALSDVATTVWDAAVREHVSLYFYENPDKYKIIHLIAPQMWKAENLRLQLDYPEDLKFIRAVYSRLEPQYGDSFGIHEILNLLKQDPALREINAHCVEKAVR